MMRSRASYVSMSLMAICAFPTHAFVPSLRNSNAFVRSTPLHMTPTRHYSDWELPDDLPEKRSSPDAPTSPLERSEARRVRLEQEAALSTKFVTGNDLYHLREQAMNLREELKQARMLGATQRVHELERAILKVQQVDAEFIYAVSLERMNQAEAEGRTKDAEEYRLKAMEARSALPQFNLDGLWVGKYGDNLYEMINVTYVGDTLYAYKVTGHSTVPRGKVSFQADLSPVAREELLEPIQLGQEASEQWGIEYLPRFKGEGQVASQGFVDPQFVDGQLIMVNEYFSFAWIPVGHQVFFGRPSAELTLKMLNEINSPQSEVEKSRAHLERCLEETEILEEEIANDYDVVYSTNRDHYYDMDGAFE